jgi:hypothetical protein
MSRSTPNQVQAFLVAAMVAAAAGCAQVEAEVPAAEVTQKNIAFQGTGMADSVWSGEVAATQTFELSSDNLAWVKELNSKVYLTQIDLMATRGASDLGFIQFARVTMSDAQGNDLPVELINYARAANAPASPQLSAKTPHPIDISKMWTAKKVLVTVSVAGTLPELGWSVDVTLHLSGKISYKL